MWQCMQALMLADTCTAPAPHQLNNFQKKELRFNQPEPAPKQDILIFVTPAYANTDSINLLSWILNSESTPMPENRDKYPLTSEAAQEQLKGLPLWAETNARWVKKDGDLELCENYNEADISELKSALDKIAEEDCNFVSPLSLSKSPAATSDIGRNQ
jgi:hypothetical protein